MLKLILNQANLESWREISVLIYIAGDINIIVYLEPLEHVHNYLRMITDNTDYGASTHTTSLSVLHTAHNKYEFITLKNSNSRSLHLICWKILFNIFQFLTSVHVVIIHVILKQVCFIFLCVIDLFWFIEGTPWQIIHLVLRKHYMKRIGESNCHFRQEAINAIN